MILASGGVDSNMSDKISSCAVPHVQAGVVGTLIICGGGVRSICYCLVWLHACGNVSCVPAVVKDCGFFQPWGVEICCMFV